MDLLKYVSKRQLRTIKNISSNEMRSLKLCSKKKILLTSLFTGLVGGDRFLLGHCKRGILKVTLFLALFIAIVALPLDADTHTGLARYAFAAPARGWPLLQGQ